MRKLAALNFIRTLFLLCLVSCGQAVTAQAQSTPSQAANNFYRTYLKLNIRGLPSDEQMKVLSPLITTDLKGLFENAQKEQTKFIKENPNEKPPWGDGDLFTSLFEGAQSFRLGRAKVRRGQADVPVHLAYTQGGSTSRWSDILILVRRGNRWLVSDILLKGDWAFKSGASLRENLRPD